MGLFDKFKNKTENEKSISAPKIQRISRNIDGKNVVVYCNEALSTDVIA